MRRKLKIYVITVILSFMVLVVGLWSYRASQPSLLLAPLRVGHLVVDELHQPGWCVAEERGFIKAEGFRAIHSEYIHGPQEMEHFGAGELDVAYVGAAPFPVARASGVGIVAVTSSNTEGSSLVVANDIHNISDLQGMKIGSPRACGAKVISCMLSGILAFLWFCSGVIFVMMFLSELNGSARYFIGILFVIQGILLLVWGTAGPSNPSVDTDVYVRS